jgi:hypothetical protein
LRENTNKSHKFGFARFKSEGYADFGNATDFECSSCLPWKEGNYLKLPHDIK